MLDVLVGVVIEGFRVSTKGPDQTWLEPAAAAAPPPPPSEGTGTKNGSTAAGSDSGGDVDVDVDWDARTSSGNSVGADEGSAKGGSPRGLSCF